MSRLPRYWLSVEYTDKDGYKSTFEAEEETQQDAFLLAAKLVGYYQRADSKIGSISVKDTKTEQYLTLPRGLRALYF